MSLISFMIMIMMMMMMTSINSLETLKDTVSQCDIRENKQGTRHNH